nr:ORF59 [Human gammaherpesvirus 8]
MPVDFHYGVRVDVTLLSKIRRVNEHIKSATKTGVVQVHGSACTPTLSVLSSVGTAGVLGLRIKNALTPLVGHTEGSGDVSFSFRNTSVGSGFTHTRELFGANVLDAGIAFYRKGEACDTGPQPQFVRTTISYGDNLTSTVHKSVVDQKGILPFHDRMEAGGRTTRLLLCGKTGAFLLKWLRQQKTKEDQTVTVSVSETLSIVTFSLGGVSKIIDFKPETKPVSGWDGLKGKKSVDVGVVHTDALSRVSLESLIAALRLCKVPGWFTPGLIWHSNEILEVEGVPTGCQSGDVKLSVLLLEVNRSVSAEGGESSQKVPDSIPDSRRQPELESPDSPPLTPVGPFGPLEDASEDAASVTSCPPAAPTKDSTKRPNKRRSDSSQSRDRGKVPKTTFNPLI